MSTGALAQTSSSTTDGWTRVTIDGQYYDLPPGWRIVIIGGTPVVMPPGTAYADAGTLREKGKGASVEVGANEERAGGGVVFADLDAASMNVLAPVIGVDALAHLESDLEHIQKGLSRLAAQPRMNAVQFQSLRSSTSRVRQTVVQAAWEISRPTVSDAVRAGAVPLLDMLVRRLEVLLPMLSSNTCDAGRACR